MKKYLVLFSLITSCNGLGTSNNVIENEGSSKNGTEDFSGSRSLSVKTDDKCIQAIDIAVSGNVKCSPRLLKHHLIHEEGSIFLYGFGNDACFVNGGTFGLGDGCGTSYLAGRFSRKLMKRIASFSSESPKDKINDSYMNIVEKYKEK